MSRFQALILCGPGASLNTFTSSPDEFPKALVPVANRPMVWYALNFCYGMNISNITLITPPSSYQAIEDALSRNPYLTSLPSPKPDILAPQGLSENTGTAEILRFREVQAVVNGDFIILPCDLVCELLGDFLIESWMANCTGLIGFNLHSGGLGVWFPIQDEYAVKGEETDFLQLAPLDPPSVVQPPSNSLRPNLSTILRAISADTLYDKISKEGVYKIRHTLIKKHGRTRILPAMRDAHVYLFPRWVLDFVNRNQVFESISEDVVGWWARAGWQDGLVSKLHLDEILRPPHPPQSLYFDQLANIKVAAHTKKPRPIVPPMLAYVHPHSAPGSSHPRIRRTDTPALLLHMSLYIAALPPTSLLAHSEPVHPTCAIANRTTISPNCLLGPNTTVAEFARITTSVVGANCVIGSGAKITNCILMDEVVIEEKVSLTGCVVGPRAKVEKGVVLKEGCEVQPGFIVGEGTEGKDRVFMVSGLDEEVEGERMEGLVML